MQPQNRFAVKRSFTDNARTKQNKIREALAKVQKEVAEAKARLSAAQDFGSRKQAKNV
jgi:hypothetical protein